MNIYEDTFDWLGCPTPLEMYQHQCALLEDELIQTQAMLRRARANIAGLVKMNDALITAKAELEKEIIKPPDRFSDVSYESSDTGCFRPLDLVSGQRDYLLRENQRLLMELNSLKKE